MVDDKLAVSECGNKGILKNAELNSFVEIQCFTLSKDKSEILHFGKEAKYNIPCSSLKVQEDFMQKEESTKYLSNILG